MTNASNETNETNETDFNILLAEIRKTRTELKNIIEASETRVLLKLEFLNEKVKLLERENENLKHKFELIERNIKKNNLLVYGLKLEEYNSTERICQTLSHILEITLLPSDINEYYMLNIPQNPLKVNLISNLKKKEILENCRKLKGSDIIIRHDLTYIQRQEQKILRDHLKKARENSEIKSYIRGNKLYIGEKEYTIENLKTNINNNERPNSEPSTPVTTVKSPTFIEESTEISQVNLSCKETPKIRNIQPRKNQAKIYRANEAKTSNTRERLRSHKK